MLYLGLFIVELISLFFISKKLVNSIATLIYKFGGSEKLVVNFLAVLFLPGTIIHELAHLLVAGVMLVHVGEIDLVPKTEGEGVRLGSVQIGKTDPLRRMIIGVAPVLAGLSIILGVLYYMPSVFNIAWWQILIVLLIIFQIGNTMFSSKKDMEGVTGFFVAIITVSILILVFLNYTNILPWESAYYWLINLDFSNVYTFSKLGSFYLSIPIILDLLIILVALPITRRR